MQAKSLNRLNALMGDSMGGMMSLSRKKKLNVRSQDPLLAPDPKCDEKIVFFITPQVKVDRIVNTIEQSINQKMAEDVDNKKYDPVRAKLMCQALSKDIRNKVKLMQISRHRIVCLVSIIEKMLQSIDYKMRLCLDNNSDYHANYKFECAQYYIITTVFIVYKD